MTTIIAFAVGAILGGIAGLLVGRKNPKVADTAQALADKVKK